MLLYLISGRASSAAPDINHIIRAFDALCVATKLDRGAIETTVNLFAKHTQSKIMPATEEILKLTSLEAKAGWGLSDGTTPFVIIYGEKRVKNLKSTSCGISFQDIASDVVIRNIESRYKLKKEMDRVQGVSRIIMYQADLIQYGDADVLFGIQSSDIEGINIISIFDIR